MPVHTCTLLHQGRLARAWLAPQVPEWQQPTWGLSQHRGGSMGQSGPPPSPCCERGARVRVGCCLGMALHRSLHTTRNSMRGNVSTFLELRYS